MRIVVFLILGILAGEQVGDFSIWWVALGGGLFVLCASLFLQKRALLQSVLAFAGTFLFGLLMAGCQRERAYTALPQGETLYKAVLISQPEKHGKVVRCDMLVLSGELTGRKIRASIYCDTVAHRYRALEIGKAMLASSVLKPLEEDSYQRVQGFSATTFIYWRNWQLTSADLKVLSLTNRVMLKALVFRHRLVEAFRQSGLSGKELAVVAAMSLGDKSMLDKSVREDFSISGGSHVLALSGLHLGIIYSMLTFLFGGRRRFLSQFLILLTVWSFVTLVGMSSSVVRSATMLTVYSVASLLHRDSLSLNALAFAAIVLLVVNPACLHDVGFQLSFVTVFFLLLMMPELYHLLGERLLHYRFVRWLWATLLVAFVAQMGAAPLVAYYFGRFSCYFLLTNILVALSATFIICGSFALAVFIPLRPYIAVVLTFITKLFVSGIQGIATLPGASMEGIRLNGWQVVFAYAFLLLLFRLFLIKK